MAPICPHFAEEAWETLGYKTEVYNEDWPKCNEDYIKDDKIVIPIQINGKKRDEILVDVNISKEEINKIVLSKPKIRKFLDDEPKKIIFVPKRIINIVL